MLYLLCASDVKFALRHSGDVKAPSGFTRVTRGAVFGVDQISASEPVCSTSGSLLNSPVGCYTSEKVQWREYLGFWEAEKKSKSSKVRDYDVVE